VAVQLRVLFIEDSADDEALLVRALTAAGFHLEHQRVETEEALRAALAEGPWDAVICDWSLPCLDALRALKLLSDSRLDLPFLIVSGTVGEEAAVEAMRAGAHDYVMKSNLRRLPETLRREVREAGLRRDRRSLEEQVRKAQKLGTVGLLASGVAHELNNLLTVVLGGSQLVHGDLPESHASRKDLDEVIECARRATALTRQLLALGRGSNAHEPQQVDLNGVLESTGQLLRRLVGKHIEYLVRPGEQRAATVADPGLLDQVLVNLVLNARDAMPDGGTLTVSTRVVERAGLPFVVLTVTDTGVGMTAEVRSRIFEPFFTTKPGDRGTGLGLSTVLGIAKQYGGDVLVQSEPGRGTLFEVYLPQAPS
jgi:signal transduction histidine kinase